MKEILNFINRRFSKDCDWINGNCYYFSLILKDRFPKGEIVYNVTDGHFLYKYQNMYYDWTGVVQPQGYLVEWDMFSEYDRSQKTRIVENCLM